MHMISSDRECGVARAVAVAIEAPGRCFPRSHLGGPGQLDRAHLSVRNALLARGGILGKKRARPIGTHRLGHPSSYEKTVRRL